MPTPHPGYDESTRGSGLAGLLEVARRRRGLALLPFLFVITAAASLAFFLPSLWTARALILVNRPQIPETYVRSSVNSDLEARLLTLGQQVLSPPRLQKIIAKHDLYRAERATATPDEVVDKMRRDIQIQLQDDRDPRRAEPRTLVFSVAYRATDPVVAADVTNTLAALFIAENSRLREAQATGLTLTEIGSILDLRSQGEATCRHVVDLLERHLDALDRHITTLRRTRRKLASLTERARNLDPADCLDPNRCQTISGADVSELGSVKTGRHLHAAPSGHHH